jgi:hypothetical protein
MTTDTSQVSENRRSALFALIPPIGIWMLINGGGQTSVRVALAGGAMATYVLVCSAASSLWIGFLLAHGFVLISTLTLVSVVAESKRSNPTEKRIGALMLVSVVCTLVSLQVISSLGRSLLSMALGSCSREFVLWGLAAIVFGAALALSVPSMVKDGTALDRQLNEITQGRSTPRIAAWEAAFWLLAIAVGLHFGLSTFDPFACF